MIEHEQLPPGEAPSLEDLRGMFIMPFEIEPPQPHTKPEPTLRAWMIIPAICSFILGVIATFHLYNML